MRAGIEPFAWIINQALTPLRISDPVLAAKRLAEATYLEEVRHNHASRAVLVPWVEPGGDLAPWLRTLVASGPSE